MPQLEREELISPLDRALVIFSHPDDAEFSAASTIALLTAGGARVDYVVTTDGGKGTEDPAVTPAQLTATREAEQRAAADVLGVSEIVHLGYPDGYLTPSLELRRDIVRQIRRFRPDLVIAQNPMRRQDGNPFIGHPGPPGNRRGDPRGGLPGGARSPPLPELLEEGLEPWKVRQVLVSGVEQPNLFLDVSNTFQVGLDALFCHDSQIGDRVEVEANARERAVERGKLAGMALASAFLSITLE